MGTGSELCFEVYVRTHTTDVMVVRDVSFRTAYVVARHHANTRGGPVFIRNRATRAIDTVGGERS